jgi:CHAT domain-containing protein
MMIPRLSLLSSLLSLSICLPALATSLQVGEAVEVLWNNSWWPAKVQRLEGDRYCITYEGFDHSWDECITSDRIRPVQASPEAAAKRLYQTGFQNLIRRQYVAAITDLEKSLRLAQVNHLDSVASLVVQERTLNALALAYVIVGDFQQLQKTAEHHLKVAEQLQDPSAATIALTRLGSSYFYRGDFTKAASLQQQAIDRAASGAPATQKFAIAALAETYLAQGQPQSAIALFQQIKPLGTDPELQLTALQGLGVAYTMQQQYPQAVDVLQQAIQLAERNQGLFDSSQLGNAVNNLGYALYRSSNLPQAEAQLRRALKIWETQRSPIDPTQLLKVSLLESQILSYNTLQKVLVQQHQPEAALEISEQGRAQVFLELVAERISPEAAHRLATEAITLARIRAVAKTHRATLVEYSLIDTRPQFSIPGQVEATELLIWVVKPTGEVVFRSVDLQSRKSAIENLVFEAREAIGAGGRAGANPLAQHRPNSPEKLRQLYDFLIAPIADQLPTDPQQRVIFIPQRQLFLVPFPALLNPAGQPLIDQHTILTAPSIQALELMSQRSPRSQMSPLIVGNPTMPTILTQASTSPESLSSLPGAEAEATTIAHQLNSVALTGAQAKRSIVLQRMPQASLIHLATHGLLDDFQGIGIPGAIALAPDGTGEPNDGLLTAGDLLDPKLRLQAELVVLSACDTGRGRVTGDGVLGLARSLMVAGTPSVIVSLWKVPDQPTANLMTTFYQSWRQQGLDKAQALRQAMRQVKQTAPDPINWAAFTLIGSAD